MRSYRFLFSLLFAGAASLFGASAPAQITPDQTLGQAESSILTPAVTIRGESVELIEGGAVRGANLFHSFSDFNITKNARVYFFNPAQVDTILSRVTGDRTSNILGTLGVNGPADLFFINPNGIVFGPQSSLDIEGSFYATTAEAVTLGNSLFSATNPEQSQLLAIQPDTSFFTHLTPRSGNITSSARLESGGNLGLAATNLTLGDQVVSDGNLSLMASDTVQAIALSSQDATSILSGGHALFNTYTGPSLQILAGGVVLANQITITGPSLSTTTAPPVITDIETANGQALTLDGGTTATLDVRAGIDWANLQSTLPSQLAQYPTASTPSILPETGLAILPETGLAVGTARITSADGILFLSNQFAANPDLLTSDIAVGELVTGDVDRAFNGNAGSVLLDSRGAITLFNRIATESLFGNGGDIRLFAEGPVILENSSLSTAIGAISTTVSDNRRAGNIEIDSGSFSLRNGQVATDTNTVGDSGDLTIRARETVTLQGIPGGVVTTLSTGVRSNGAGLAGTLTINTRQLSVNSAQVSSSISGAGRAGALTITATEQIDLRGELLSSEGKRFPGGVFAQIDVDDEGSGNQLTIRAPRLNISDGSKVQVGSFGDGDAGTLTLYVSDINLFNTVQPEFLTGIFAGILQDPTSSTTLPEGDGGQIIVYADRLRVRDGARVTADLSGAGTGGNIFIRATELLEVVGVGNSTPSTIGAEVSPPGVDTPVTPDQVAGRSGDVTIETARLSLREGGQISVSTFGNGDSGDIQIQESQRVEIMGRSPDGLPSSISARTGKNASGDGGNITVNAQQLALSSGGEVNARSDGASRAGNITLNLNGGQLTVDDGDIRTSAANAAGGGVEITASTVLLTGDGDIRTDVSRGESAGGNITIAAESVIALDDSDILAFANDGSGGNIVLNTPAFFGENYRLGAIAPFDNNNQVNINASGLLASGAIVIPDVGFIDNELSELSDELVNTEQLVANSCIVQGEDTAGTLRLGRSIRRLQPTGDVGAAAYSTGNIQPIPNAIRPAAITEPQAIYQLTDGRLVMNRDCSS